jgi:hypothetical protein
LSSKSLEYSLAGISSPAIVPNHPSQKHVSPPERAGLDIEFSDEPIKRGDVNVEVTGEICKVPDYFLLIFIIPPFRVNKSYS